MFMPSRLRRLWSRIPEGSFVGRRAALLTAEADAARDAGKHLRAAEAYAAVVALHPHRLDLTVQQANMLKDAGRLAEAVALYRAVLESTPRDPDVHLQLGHALKRSGQVTEALAAYETALALDPNCASARRELVDAGRWQAQIGSTVAVAHGDATDPLVKLTLEVEALSRRLDALRAALPEAARLHHVPAALYRLWRERCDAAVPPTAPQAAPRLVVLLDGTQVDSSAGERIVAAIQAQHDPNWALFAWGPAVYDAAARVAMADHRVRWSHGFDPSLLGLCGTEDWCLALEPGVAPQAHATGWLRWAAATTSARVLTGDFECLEGDTVLEGRLRGAPDADALLSGADWPEAIALPVALLLKAVHAAPPGMPVHESAADVLLQEAMVGRAGHVPVPLAIGALSQIAAPRETWISRARRYLAVVSPEATVARSLAHPVILRVAWPSGAVGIDVIIPTRDGGPDLDHFVKSLLDHANRPDAVRIVVLDNSPAQTVSVRAGAFTDQVMVRPVPGPFHWSLMNNAAAAQSDADLLIFANDDMTMLSVGWDARVAAQLARPNIGAVGARLLYPDGQIQHAGMLTGWRGGVIHDGLGAAATDPGPCNRWRTPRQVSAVTGAFLATQRALFSQLGGFHERMAIGCSDVDYCLKLRNAGMAILYDPEIELVHVESRSRGRDAEDATKAARAEAESAILSARWGGALEHDPSMNPHYSAFGKPFQHLEIPSRARLLAHAALTCSGAAWRPRSAPPSS